MIDVKMMIKNKCEDDRTLATRLAKLIGYKDRSSLYKFLNDTERDPDFQKILTIVQELFPERELDIMSEYIRGLNPSKQSAREALEYANINKLHDLFEELLYNLSSCKNKISQEWAKVYQINLDVVNGNKERMEAINEINTITFKSDEMKVFSKIIQFYYYHDLKLIDIMADMSFLIEDGLKNVKDSFVKVHYECRFITIIAAIYLHTNKLELLRERINDLTGKITNHNLLNVMYVLIGNSYIMENYDMALGYYQKALHHSETVNNIYRNDQAKKSINLLNSFWNKKKEFIAINEDDDSLLADKAFNICNFSKEEGMELLKQVDYSSFSNSGKGFYFYYLGVASDNEDFFFESVEYFNMDGEKFFKKLPLIELEKMGVKKSILKALSV